VVSPRHTLDGNTWQYPPHNISNVLVAVCLPFPTSHARSVHLHAPSCTHRHRGMVPRIERLETWRWKARGRVLPLTGAHHLHLDRNVTYRQPSTKKLPGNFHVFVP
jgi:hypothetical protein